MHLDINAYLERINYRDSLEPGLETLRGLQDAHLQAVPFENLSIHSGEPITLEEEALFEKIVRRRRGGFCYELNGLFAALLRTLGFKVEMLSAGVANAGGDFGPDFDHMTLMVELEQRWLADVGFGDSFRQPLLLDFEGEQAQGERTYQIISAQSHRILMQRDNGAEWKKQYRFTLQPRQFPDYAAMCHYHQTSPQSHFTQGRICSRATREGRISLSEMRLITTSIGGQRQERNLKTPGGVRDCPARAFWHRHLRLTTSSLGIQVMKKANVEIGRANFLFAPTAPLTTEIISMASGRLAKSDRHLAEVLQQNGPPPLWGRRPGFATLIRIILEQQVSLASAASMYGWLGSQVAPFTPERFVELGEGYLRSLGLTRQKSAYCVHLSRSIVNGDLNLQAIKRLGDQDARAALMRIKGIGFWSADIYLLMALRRPDIWPAGDVALVTAVTQLKQLSARPSTEQLLKMAEAWRPFRAVAARMLWQYYLARRLRRTSSPLPLSACEEGKKA